MKKNKIIIGLAIFFALMFIVFGIITAVYISSDSSFRFGYDYEFGTHSEAISPYGVSRIEIETIANDIEVSFGAKDITATFNEFMDTDENNPSFRFELVGGTLYIKSSEPDNFWGQQAERFSSEEGEIIIVLPSEFIGEIIVKTVSGNSDISVYDVASVNLKSVSGDASISGIIALGCNVKTISGNIIFGGMLTTGGIDIGTVSGNVEVHCDYAVETSINTVSGNALFSVYSASRGDIDLHFDSLSGDLSTSNFVADYFEGGEVDISFKSFSGNFTIDNLFYAS